MKTKEFVTKINKAKDNLEMVEIFDQVELDATLAERKRLIEQFRYMIKCHSGKDWGHYTADTAVTEYRAHLLSKLEWSRWSKLGGKNE